MAIYHVNTEGFQKEVLESSQPVLVDFYADWCGPCKMLAPTMDAIASENADIKVCKVNVDDAPEIASRYGIMSIPTVLAFVNGELKNKVVGLQPKQNLVDLVK